MRRIALLGIFGVALACLSGRLLAQGQMPASTRVAVLNIGQVFNKYEKAIQYKAEMDKLLKPFRDQSEKWKTEMAAYQKALQDPKTSPDDKLKYQQALVQYKRAMEDLEIDTQKKVGKNQEENIITLYKDVTLAVKAYAEANGIHLVLAFGEQIDGDPYNFANISRKMQGMDLGSTAPLYFAGNSDITLAVTEHLNRSYRTVPATPASQKK